MKTAVLLLSAACVLSAASEGTPQMPMPNNYANSILTRWLAKPVLASKLLDGAESLDNWAIVNTGQSKGTVALSAERKMQGSSAVKLTARTTGDQPIPTERYFGMATASRKVSGENWNDYNRLSFWIYPDLPGFRVVSFKLIFRNDGAEKSPDVYGKLGNNYLILRNQEWNHVVWEIANLPRDRVTAVDFMYLMQGNEPGATDTASFFIDQVELEKVNADHHEGWNVAPGEIAFSHSGYQTGAAKTALASDLREKQFQLVNQETGMPVLTKAIRAEKSAVGEFQVMDFSEVRTPGLYSIRAGEAKTRPFRIGDDVWKSSIWKAINFFYTERCGFAIPGVHDACHRDWLLVNGDKKIVANGGWHDAGDLSQGLHNTAEATHAMFTLAERLQQRGEEPELRKRLIEEAAWGLDWVMKVSFGNGYRAGFVLMDRWTNGIIGDADDMVAQAVNSPAINYMSAMAEAVGARVMRDVDPTVASYSLAKARKDWEFAVQGATPQQQAARPHGVAETAAHGVLASIELWRTTGEQKYADKAIELGEIVAQSQQRKILPELNYPLTGWFFTGPDREQVLRYNHLSHEAAPGMALVSLCESFPDHADWMQWYSGVVLYTSYFQQPMAAFSQPYGMLANSIFRGDEYKRMQANARVRASAEAFRDQVNSGTKVGDNHYVRLFPVWFQMRGNHGTVLTQTKVLSAAAHLRGDRSLAALSTQQLEWVMGKNPFVQSTMWGEGYDYAPQYSAMSGDLVGSLPVGIQTKANRDVPYWPTENCHNWKEVWVVPVSRWFWLMRDLAGPALVSGSVDAGTATPVEFRDTRTGAVTKVALQTGSASFRAMVPEGEYDVSSNGRTRRVTLLPGGSYSVDLRPQRSVDVRLTQETRSDGVILLRAEVFGEGRHTLAVRTSNAAFTTPERTVTLEPGKAASVTWQGKMGTADEPWVAVVVPDRDFNQREEISGTTRPFKPLT